MAISKAAQEEADRLHEALSDEVPKKVLLSGFKEYSEASKNEVVARVLRSISPAPEAGLLARLPFIRTAANEASLRTIFLTNLRSPHAEARKASLTNLKELRHPGLADLALLSLRDESDSVLALALSFLLPGAKEDPSVKAFLEALHAARKGREEYHMSVSLLEAHGIGAPRSQ